MAEQPIGLRLSNISERTERVDAWPWRRWFIVIAAICGLISMLTTPAFAGADEIAHIMRVEHLSQGSIVPIRSGSASDRHIDRCFSSYLTDQSLLNFAKPRNAWRSQFTNPPCVRGNPAAPPSRTADVYSPVPYVPAIVGFRVGRSLGGAAGSLYGARLVQLVAFIVLMALAIEWAPWGKPLLFTIGVLPVTFNGAAGVSADPITLALACGIVSLVLAMIDDPERARVDRTKWWVLGASIVALGLSKSAYVPFALLLLAIPVSAFGNRRRQLLVIGTILGSVGVLAGLWNLGVVSHVDIVGVNHSNSAVAAGIIRDHPFGFLAAIVHGWSNPIERHSALSGFFTHFHRFAHNFPIPLWFGFTWLALARLAEPLPAWMQRTFARRTEGPLRDPASNTPGSLPQATRSLTARPKFDLTTRWTGRFVAMVVALGTFLLIEYGLAIAANPPHARRIIWVQGRYFLPLLPLTLLGVALGVPPRRVRWHLIFPMLSVGVALWWFWWYLGRTWTWF